MIKYNGNDPVLAEHFRQLEEYISNPDAEVGATNVAKLYYYSSLMLIQPATSKAGIMESLEGVFHEKVESALIANLLIQLEKRVSRYPQEKQYLH